MGIKVLVTDGENRSALAVTRSLGRRGCRVLVSGAASRTMASSSRYCQKGFQVSDPLKSAPDYARQIIELTAREGVEAIFPLTEASIYLLNEVRDRLPEGVILACPSAEKMRAVSDKSSLCRLAERLGVPVPETQYLACAEEITVAIEKIVRYPVVVKPAMSRIYEGDGFLSGGVMYARSREELEHLYRTRPVLQHPSLIQEKIIGPGTGLFTLFDKDRHLALFSHRRLREKPPSGGVSVVSESIPLDEEMVSAAERLLSVVGWTGVAMVEFKRDQRDGKAKLMEINGRFWGSLQLAVACGVDFPGLLLDYHRGQKPTAPPGEYLVGHKLKWILGTLDHLLIRLKNSSEKINLPTGSPSRGRAVIDFLNFYERHMSFDVFDRNDMGPFRYEIKEYIRRMM